jgi:ABC-type branched-subunit amino acid transport system ATPase component
MSKSEVVSGYGDVIAVQCVSLDVSPGSITVLLGSNGAGKTTLLKTIAGLVGARNGRIRFGGSDITR